MFTRTNVSASMYFSHVGIQTQDPPADSLAATLSAVSLFPV